VDLAEVDCVDREATSASSTSCRIESVPFLHRMGSKLALHSIYSNRNAVDQRERLRMLGQHWSIRLE
jgi:hypothetical protein